MAERPRRPLRGVAVALAAALAVLAAPPAGAQEPAPSPRDPAAVVDGAGPDRPGTGPILRERPADVAPDALPARGPARARLDLFADVDVSVVVQPSGSGVDGWDAWTGTIAGRADSSVVLVSDGTTVTGRVASPDGAYRIGTDAEGDHVVQELGDFPERSDDAVPGPGPVGSGPSGAAHPDGPAPVPDPLVTAGDVPDHPVIDVLVGHTPEARAAAGSTPALEAEIAAAIASTNAAYATTGVAGQVRLAGTYRIDTPGLRSDNPSLYAVTIPNDGVVDGILPAADAVGADLVAVITEGTASSCGIGFLPGRTTITDLTCAVGNLSFAHELGHNLGLHHDRFVADDNDVYPYGYGYVDVAGGWRTVMAYNNACAAELKICTRLARFSNPDQEHEGAPVGIPRTEPDSADNRLALLLSLPAREEIRSRPAPFTSWARFVQQQNRDFRFGATLPTSQVDVLATRLHTGLLRPSAYVDELAHGAYADVVAPITRLYWAYYLRRPDTAGLDYWVGVRRGGRSLATISQSFATLPEFAQRYGSLTNRQFVERIYLNILERPGEPSGVTYWTRELDTGVRTRGSVMLGFSEAAEYRSERANEVDAVLLHRAMLQRVPTVAEIQAFDTRREAGVPLSRLIIEILGRDEYAPRAS